MRRRASIAASPALGSAVGVASGVVAGAVVLGFFAVGQGLQWVVADASPRIALVVALGSYALRVVGLGMLAMAATAAGATAVLHPTALVLATAAVTVGWITGEVLAFRRLRIPVFDPVDGPPRGMSG